MENKTLSAIIEAILLAYGEPLSLDKIIKITGKEKNKVEEALIVLKEKYKGEESGLNLVENKNMVRLVSSPELSKYIEKLVKDDFDDNLSSASLETLTTVLYLSPVSRAEIDYIRGVNSTFTLRSLLLRGLLERRPDPKRPYLYLYEPTFDLLQYLGVSSVSELPDYEKYNGLLKLNQLEENKNEQK